MRAICRKGFFFFWHQTHFAPFYFFFCSCSFLQAAPNSFQAANFTWNLTCEHLHPAHPRKNRGGGGARLLREADVKTKSEMLSCKKKTQNASHAVNALVAIPHFLTASVACKTVAQNVLLSNKAKYLPLSNEVKRLSMPERHSPKFSLGGISVQQWIFRAVALTS